MLNSLVDEAYHGISFDVAHVHMFTVSFDRWMMLHHEPTHMREEETALCIVGIRGGIRIPVMRAVDAYPLGRMGLQEANLSRNNALAKHDRRDTLKSAMYIIMTVSVTTFTWPAIQYK